MRSVVLKRATVAATDRHTYLDAAAADHNLFILYYAPFVLHTNNNNNNNNKKIPYEHMTHIARDSFFFL